MEIIEVGIHAARGTTGRHRHRIRIIRQLRHRRLGSAGGRIAADCRQLRAEHAGLIRVAVFRVVLGGGEGDGSWVLAVVVGKYGLVLSSRCIGPGHGGAGIVICSDRLDAGHHKVAILNRNRDRHHILRTRIVEPSQSAGRRRDLRQRICVRARLREGDVTERHALRSLTRSLIRQRLLHDMIAVGVHIGNGTGIGGTAGRQRRALRGL